MKRIFFKLRSAFLVFLTHRIALPALKKIRRPITFDYNREKLMLFPEGSLGKDLYEFLESRNLPLLKHYARHDLKHVLLSYDTTDAGEACLQCFMMGNGRLSFPVLVTVLYGMVTMPEYWQNMRQAYKQGRKSKSIHGWKWNEILYEQTTDLREKIFSHPEKMN